MITETGLQNYKDAIKAKAWRRKWVEKSLDKLVEAFKKGKLDKQDKNMKSFLNALMNYLIAFHSCKNRSPRRRIGFDWRSLMYDYSKEATS